MYCGLTNISQAIAGAAFQRLGTNFLGNTKVRLAGKLEVQVGKSKQKKTFGITRAHLEEDAGDALQSRQAVLMLLDTYSIDIGTICAVTGAS